MKKKIVALKNGQPYDLNVGWPQVEEQGHEGQNCW